MKKNICYWLVLLVMSVLMQGCYSHRVIGLLQEPTKMNKLPVYEKDTVLEPYRLHVNDEIIYRLFTLDNTMAALLSYSSVQWAGSGGNNYVNSYRIYEDGTIELPFLKPVHAEGLTIEELQDTLQMVFREIIPDADVKVALYNKTFTVLGDIGSGERYIYKEKMNIFQALAMTGDLMNSGDRRHVRIIRPRGNDEPEVLEFDIRTNSIIESKYYYIQPNDVIYVARTKDSFVKVASYAGTLGLITSSVALLTTVLNYAANMLYK